MRAEVFEIHWITPEIRKLNKIVNKLKQGAVILYPTDTGFTLGCQLANKNAIEKLRKIRNISAKKSLTFLCKNLSNISTYAKISNNAYKTIKSLIPGPYTFILPATKIVPQLAINPNRKTVGIRVPDNIIAHALLELIEEPLISISAKIGEDDSFFFLTPDEFIDSFSNLVDIIIKTEHYNFVGESTVIDMVNDEFKIIRKGAGYENVDYIDIETTE